MELCGVLIGHSFVRRMRQGLLARPTRVAGKPGVKKLCQPPEKIARGLDVFPTYDAIHTDSTDIFWIANLPGSIDFINDLSPSVVMIEIGSNDLAHADFFNPGFMLKLATQVVEFAAGISAQIVIINAILPRTGRITCDHIVFRQNADLYNTIIHNYCDTNPKLLFNRLRGLSQTIVSKRATKLEHCQPPRPVSDWSADGIHCDRPHSKRLYQKRVKFALLETAHKLLKPKVDAHGPHCH